MVGKCFECGKDAVAQCKCGKGLCKECYKRYGKADDKYIDKCRECLLKQGIGCTEHPEKQAERFCYECGDPICEDCFTKYGYCYKCAKNNASKDINRKSQWIKDKIAELSDTIAVCEKRGNIENGKIGLVIVFSVIGLIIGGLILGDIASNDYYNTADYLLGFFLTLWFFVGIGGNFREALSGSVNSDFCDGVIEKDGFGVYFFMLAMVLAWHAFLLFLKSLAGPIIPIIKIRGYTKLKGIAQATVIDGNELLRKMVDYQTYVSQFVGKNIDEVNFAELEEQYTALVAERVKFNEYVKSVKAY